MKPHHWLVLGLVLLCGCSRSPDATIKDDLGEELNIWEVRYEGCEYLATKTYGGSVTLCHKGDCTNSIHVYNATAKKPQRKDE